MAIVSLFLIVALVLGAGAGALVGSGGSSPSTTAPPPTSPLDPAATTTAPPDYTGDADSPFCALVRDGDELPTLDPFEPEIEPREVELRFRAFRLRFEALRDVAPVELAADLEALVAAVADLDATLEAFDYDFAALGSSGVDLSGFDDPVFIDAGARLAQYRAQVCEQG